MTLLRLTLAALLSHWWRHPMQLLTLLVGLATATALWSGVQAVNAEARASYDAAAGQVAAGARAMLVADQPIAQDTYVALRRAGYAVSPMIEGTRDGLRLIGIDAFTLPPSDAPADLGTADVQSEFIAAPGLLLASAGTEISDDLPPVRRTEGIPAGTAYADIGTAQRLLNQPGTLTRLIVTGPPARTAPPLDSIAPNLRQTQPQDSDVGRLTDSFHLNLTAFGLLSFVVGLFIVRGAIGLAFAQRRGVFRTLRALGLPRVTLVGILALELLILALIAGGIGIALGWLIAASLLPDVAATLRGLYGAQVPGALSLRPTWWLSGLAVAVIGTALAASLSLWQTARLPLLAPATPGGGAPGTALRLPLIGAALCALVSAAAGIIGGGVIAGFLCLGALLLGAALALPPVLSGLLALIARPTHGPRAQWFWADARQQLPNLGLALAALLLALAANIGVGTMVSSFRLTFTGWLDQRLAAELYISASDDAQAAEIATYLTPRTDAILPIRSAETTLAGAPAEVFGVADHPTYSQHWPLIEADPNVWPRIVAGDAALVNEQLARRENLWPGDMIQIAAWTGPIAGVYSDYGNPRGQAMVGLSLFDALFPDAPRTNFGVRVDLAQVDALQAELADRFGLPPDQITDQASIKRLSLDIFERTFTVTAALNVLTLGVAALAILTSLLTLATMRLPQLAPVWALGMTRKHLAGLDLARAALLAALTFLAAVPVGLLLAWVLLTIINVEAFGWRLPMHLFPAQWARLAGLSLLAALLAAAWPALRLSRTPPSDLLKVFAHER